MDEFGFLEELKKHFNFGHIGDDCAVLPFGNDRDLLLSADLLVENIDFRLSWADGLSVGHKSVAVSLSDIAAMGGTPRWALISIAASPECWKTGFIMDFYEGAKRLGERFGVEIVGGDISETDGPLTIDSIVAGECPSGRAVLRSGAKPGDIVWVSGTLGGAAAGLSILEKGIDKTRLSEKQLKLVANQLRPIPEVILGKQLLSGNLATSMLDISDGFSSDLGHICESSGVGARIDAERLPIDPAITDGDALSELGVEVSPLSMALNGGEDFRLLFTAPSRYTDALEDLNCTSVGEIVAEAGVMKLVKDGSESQLERRGFSHFG